MKYILILILFTSSVFANIGQVTALKGKVEIIRDNETSLAKLGSKLKKSDILNSSKNSKAQITMKDKTIITIGANSNLNIIDYVFDETKPKKSKANFGFFKGSFKSITGKIGKINKERFKLKTKSASIGIRGTTIVGNQEMIACTNGEITVTSNDVTVNVPKGQLSKTPKGQAPTPPEPITKESLNSLNNQLDGNEKKEQNKESKKEEKKGKEKKEPLLKQRNDNEKATNEQISVKEPEVHDLAKNISNDTNEDETTSTIDNTTNNSITTTHKGYFIGVNQNNFTPLNGELLANTDDSTFSFNSYNQDNSTIRDTKAQDYSFTSINNSDPSAHGLWMDLNDNLISGYWVNGIETLESVISDISSPTELSFFSYLNGAIVLNGKSFEAMDNNKSTIYLKFLFSSGGSSTFDGDINIVGQSSTAYNLITSGTGTSSGFSSTNITNDAGVGSGELSGLFYGENALSSVGGNLKYEDTDTNNTIIGIFDAEKTNTTSYTGFTTAIIIENINSGTNGLTLPRYTQVGTTYLDFSNYTNVLDNKSGSLNIASDNYSFSQIDEANSSFTSYNSFDLKYDNFNISTEDSSDDNISWGYWNDVSNVYKGYWVAGVETTQDIINNLLYTGSGGTLTYTGYVIGSKRSNTTFTNINSGNSSITLNFTIDANTFNGTMDLPSLPNLTIENGTYDNQGNFSAPAIKYSGTQLGNTGLSGSFYGENGESVGGSFYANDYNVSATGAFKATKQ